MQKILLQIIISISLLLNSYSILNAEEKNYKIIKLVNNNVITNYDLEQRLKLYSTLNNINIKVGKFPFIGNGKAIAMGEPEGLIKTIFNKDTGELVGAHMVGPEVTELIQGFSIAKKLETTEHELMHTIFPHPTLSEGMHESVLDAYNQAIHY